MQPEIVIEVRLFAQARELVNEAHLKVGLAASSTVADLKRALATDQPRLAALLERSAVAVNRTYATDDQAIAAGDEVAIIPPVAGG